MAVSTEPSSATVGDSSSGRVEAPMPPDHHHQDRTARSSPPSGQSAVPQTRLLPRTSTGSSPPWPAVLLRKTPSFAAGVVRAPPSTLGERSAAALRSLSLTVP
ncbi:pollen-specific leucine-rich repeat extensin-like protein 4 [Iris pallida]|uniref:Pollen-specific leucine-rich repeat extensin-like protein 4 n=1 Tax=Iris pallida TaxID=29817 RepID=A0AAX6H6Z2_IRIPA|nr:pollen-specific leucine-rich repeat extensin-like protein 4 [Iris pallida]